MKDRAICNYMRQGCECDSPACDGKNIKLNSFPQMQLENRFTIDNEDNSKQKTKQSTHECSCFTNTIDRN